MAIRYAAIPLALSVAGCATSSNPTILTDVDVANQPFLVMAKVSGHSFVSLVSCPVSEICTNSLVDIRFSLLRNLSEDAPDIPSEFVVRAEVHAPPSPGVEVALAMQTTSENTLQILQLSYPRKFTCLDESMLDQLDLRWDEIAKEFRTEDEMVCLSWEAATPSRS